MNYFFFIYGVTIFLSISLAAMNPDQPNADAERQVFTLTIFADDYFAHAKKRATDNSTCDNILGLHNTDDTSDFIPNQKTDDTQTDDTLAFDDTDYVDLKESGYPNEAPTGHVQQSQPDSTDVVAPITIPHVASSSSSASFPTSDSQTIEPTEASASSTLSPLATLLKSASSRSTINRNNFYDEPVTRKQPHCPKRKSWSEGFHAPADFIPQSYKHHAAALLAHDNARNNHLHQLSSAEQAQSNEIASHSGASHGRDAADHPQNTEEIEATIRATVEEKLQTCLNTVVLNHTFPPKTISRRASLNNTPQQQHYARRASFSHYNPETIHALTQRAHKYFSVFPFNAQADEIERICIPDITLMNIPDYHIQ